MPVSAVRGGPRSSASRTLCEPLLPPPTSCRALVWRVSSLLIRHYPPQHVRYLAVHFTPDDSRIKGGRSQANAAFTALVVPSALPPSDMQFFTKAFAALALVAVAASAMPVTNRGDVSACPSL